MPQAWAQRIEQEIASASRPLIVTAAYATYRDLPYRFAPLGEAFQVHAGPTYDVPLATHRVDMDLLEKEPVVRLIGYRVEQPDTVRPGDQIAVDLVWQPLTRLERPYSFFVHLVGADGVPLGQRDLRHDAAPSYEPGEVLVDRYEFPVFLTASPGVYRLTAGIYVTDFLV